jgi:glycosyltransferase involved in cell wall biosynthesis
VNRVAAGESSRTGVLFINSPERFGADTWIHALLMRHVDRSRFDVHVACAVEPGNKPTLSYETISKIPDLRLRPTNFGPSVTGRSALSKIAAAPELLMFGASLVGLAAYVRRHRIRILHATDRPRDSVSCVALAALTGAKAVVHLHVKCDDWMGPAVRWAFRRADALVGISEFVSQSIVAKGYPADRVHTILNAIDPGQWDPTLDPAPFRREFGIALDAPVVASASRLFHWKGHAELIRAVAIVRRELPGVRLVIAGADYGFAGGTGHMAELQALARELGVAEHVIFTGHRTDMARILAAADVFAMASFEEPFGLVFAEAMAMKRPVVGLDSGGAPEVIDHGGSGFLAPRGDIPALAEHLANLLRDSALRARMGEHGRRRVEAKFSPSRFASDAGRLYERLLSGSAEVRHAPMMGVDGR